MSVRNSKYFAIHYIEKLLLAMSQRSREDARRLLCRYTLEMNFACSRWLAGLQSWFWRLAGLMNI